MLSEQQVETSVPTEKPSVDAITTVAIASIAIVLVQILHEGMHAATCIVVGAELQEMSALHVSCQSAEPWQSKLVSASASLANLIVGFLAFLRLRSARVWSPESRFFVWLFMLMNWMLAGGYWMFSGIGNVGDWANVIDGWTPHWVWRVVMATAGTALYMIFVWTALRVLGTIVGGDDDDEQIRRAVRLGLYAYVAGIMVILLAGLFSSYGITGQPSVAALFLAIGGMSPFLWMMQWFRSPSFVKSSGEPLIICRRWSWIVTGLVAVILYGVVLGPTIHVGV